MSGVLGRGNSGVDSSLALSSLAAGNGVVIGAVKGNVTGEAV